MRLTYKEVFLLVHALPCKCCVCYISYSVLIFAVLGVYVKMHVGTEKVNADGLCVVVTLRD